MPNIMPYAVWETSKFNMDLLQGLAATTADLDFAKWIVDQQAAIGNSYIVTDRERNRLYPEE